MTTQCQCRDCRYPAVGDPAVKERHAGFHREFQRRMDLRPDWHGFRAPSPAAMVRMAAGEWSVPAGCVRLEDRGKPAHPVHPQ